MKVQDSLRRIQLLLLMLCVLIPFYTCSLTANATADELRAEAEERKNDPVESNEVEGWPEGPCIGADAAILMDMDTGAVLYSKNIDAKEFPASTTKIMTCLLAVENCELNEVITVSQSAIDANASDGSNMSLTAGEQLTLEQILYGILINSANEGCNAVAEHISGSMDSFVELMNQRAKELGCTNTNFVTTNGLHDENHYTSAHDLALIAKEFFSYDILCQMARTPEYTIPAGAANQEHILKTHNKLYEGMEYAYPYLVGSKTGFTSNSRQCLVSCAEKDGMRLICVILREESPYQFEDTINLFEYGFTNFSHVNVAANETRFDLEQADFFNSAGGMFGSTAQLITLDEASCIILPKNISFDDLDSGITYVNSAGGMSYVDQNENGPNDSVSADYILQSMYPEKDTVMATVEYSYHSVSLGSARIILNENALSRYAFSEQTLEESLAQSENTKKIIDVRIIIAIISGVVVLLLIASLIYIHRQNQKRGNNRRKGPYRGAPKGTSPSDGRMVTNRNRIGMKRLGSGMHSITTNHNTTDYALQQGTDHARVSPPKPKKKKKPGKFEVLFGQVIDSIAGLTEAKRVEAMKQQRRERERRMKQRLREEAEQNRISGQSSIRTKQGSALRSSSPYRFDEPRAERRRSTASMEDDYGYENNSMNKSRGYRSNSYYDDYDNVEYYEEHKRKSSGRKKQKSTRSRYASYTQEEIEMIKRQEKRKRLAEQRRREMESEE